jgi:hypothetical protein
LSRRLQPDGRRRARHADGRPNHSIRRELVEFIRDLDVDEAAALVALAWIGRGDFQPEEWRAAVAEANARAEGPTWKYLLGMALLPDYLEDALSAFGRSCECYEQGKSGAKGEVGNGRSPEAARRAVEGGGSPETSGVSARRGEWSALGSPLTSFRVHRLHSRPSVGRAHPPARRNGGSGETRQATRGHLGMTLKRPKSARRR